MATKHYHVIDGMPGYMPNGNYIHTTRHMAEQDAYEQVCRDRENGERYAGSMRSGYYERIDGNYYVEITACDMDECTCRCGEPLSADDWNNQCFDCRVHAGDE